jgi:glycosyltransferase involved in cell wall biosynthesis
MDYRKFNDRQVCEIFSRFGDIRKIKVLYLSTYEAQYIRTESILDILRRNKIETEVIITGGRRFKYLKVFLSNILAKLKKCDVVFLGFRGHEVLPFLRLATAKPIIFDAFVSAYDTLCRDRRIVSPGSALGRALKCYDRFLCRISDLVLVDTQSHCRYFKEEFGADNISYLYLEPNQELFRPVKSSADRDKFVVFWYGKCWPLQGAGIILQAAHMLNKEKDIIFRLAGPLKSKYKDLIKGLDTRNIEFIEYIPYRDLPSEIARAQLCLGGHFSDVPKAQRVIAGKTFQFLACGKLTILGDNPANRELFSGDKNVHFVKVNSAEDLARGILEVKNKKGMYAYAG